MHQVQDCGFCPLHRKDFQDSLPVQNPFAVLLPIFLQMEEGRSVVLSDKQLYIGVEPSQNTMFSYFPCLYRAVVPGITKMKTGSELK
ncbi:hypothetical protein HMPREF3127_23160 [Sphingobacterium sp. HMSC13C05]|nr:hypothetical protein HMPREF3127_23160 [Sphingobacterium sp. HMSC13C05]